MNSACLSTEPEAGAPRFPHSLTVFFPAYNDAPSLPSLIEKTISVLDEYVLDYEVIVVNDGSTDSTREVLALLRSRFGKRLRVVTHERNRGYGGALRSGFAAATKEFIFYTDGDGQYDVGELPKLLEAVRPDVGLVNGYKVIRRDPRHRIWIGKVYNCLARWLFRVRLRDIDCDYRLIRRSLINRIHLTSTSGTICLEMIKKLESSSPKVVEIPVSHYPRRHGRSQFFRMRSLGTTFWQLLRLYGAFIVAPQAKKLAGTFVHHWRSASNSRHQCSGPQPSGGEGFSATSRSDWPRGRFNPAPIQADSSVRQP